MAETSKKSVFDNLYSVDVSEHKEERNGFSYLSWSWAWAEVKKRYPTANYEIEKFDGLPFVFDHDTGYMVFTKVTIDDVTHEMWLPVMDTNNQAMKDAPYSIQTKYKTIEVKAATMFDINKTIMRCLVKNLAMFGLGLYIYSGEDLPEEAAPKCADCGNPIKEYKGKGKDGKSHTWTASVIAENSEKKTGRCLCWDCWTKEADKMRKKAEQKKIDMDGEYQAIIHEDAGDRV